MKITDLISYKRSPHLVSYLCILILYFIETNAGANEPMVHDVDKNCQTFKKWTLGGQNFAKAGDFANAMERYLMIPEYCRSSDDYYLLAYSAYQLHRCKDAINYFGKIDESNLAKTAFKSYPLLAYNVQTCSEHLEYNFRSFEVIDRIEMRVLGMAYFPEVHRKINIIGETFTSTCITPCTYWMHPQKIHLAESSSYIGRSINLPTRPASIILYKNPPLSVLQRLGLGTLGFSLFTLEIGLVTYLNCNEQAPPRNCDVNRDQRDGAILIGVSLAMHLAGSVMIASSFPRNLSPPYIIQPLR